MSEGEARRPQMMIPRDDDSSVGSCDWRASRPRLQEQDDPRAALYWRGEKKLRRPRGSAGLRPAKVG